MWLDVVVMSEASFNACKEDAELLGSVYQQDKATLKKLGITKADISGCDYRTIDEAISAMNEATGEDGETSFLEEGNLDYEGTYGPAMYWSPKAFAKAVEDASGWQMAVELEKEIKALAKRAIKEKLWVIAVIN